jgi:hypothetical protein
MLRRLLTKLLSVASMVGAIASRSLLVVRSIALYHFQYSRGAEALQVPFIFFIFYSIGTFPFPPDIGWSITVLALAAIVMAIRAVTPERVTLTEQITWIVIASVICGLELYSISKANSDLEKERAETRALDIITRGVERRSIERLLMQGQTLFKQQKALSVETTNQMTGGNSFCYLSIEWLRSSFLSCPFYPSGELSTIRCDCKDYRRPRI